VNNDKLTLTPEERQEALQGMTFGRSGDADFAMQRNSVLETDEPDDAAYDLKKAQELGVPRMAVAGDRDRFRRQDEVQAKQTAREKSPKFHDWLSNPDNYAVARDDTESMGAIERTLSWLGGTGSGIVQQAGASGEKIRTGTVPNIQNAMSEEAQLAHKEFYLDGKGAGFAFYNTLPGFQEKQKIAIERHGVNSPQYKKAERDLMRFWQNYYDKQQGYESTQAEFMERYRAVQEIYERNAPEGNGIVQRTMFGAVDSLAMSVPAIIGGTVTAAATRNPGLAASVGTGLFTGPIYGEEVARGKAAGLSDEEAISRARKMTAIEAGTERLALGTFFDSSKSLGRRVLGFAARDQVGEQVATASQDAVELDYLDKGKTFDQYLAERPQAALETALTTLWMSGGMGAIQLSAEASIGEIEKRARRALMTDGEKAVSDLLDKADSSALRKRSPEKFAEAVEGMVAGSDAETMTIDLDGLSEALEQAGIDPLDAAQDFGVTPEELQQAFDMGGEFDVKTATLLKSKLARENRDALEPHIKRSGDDLTPAQRQVEMDKFNAEIEGSLDDLGEKAKEALVREDQELQVRELIAEQIGATDIYAGEALDMQARALEAIVSKMATDAGITPMEAFEQYAPRIRGVVAGEVREAGTGPLETEPTTARRFADAISAGEVGLERPDPNLPDSLAKRAARYRGRDDAGPRYDAALSDLVERLGDDPKKQLQRLLEDAPTEQERGVYRDALDGLEDDNGVLNQLLGRAEKYDPENLEDVADRVEAFEEAFAEYRDRIAPIFEGRNSVFIDGAFKQLELLLDGTWGKMDFDGTDAIHGYQPGQPGTFYAKSLDLFDQYVKIIEPMELEEGPAKELFDEMIRLAGQIEDVIAPASLARNNPEVGDEIADFLETLEAAEDVIAPVWGQQYNELKPILKEMADHLQPDNAMKDVTIAAAKVRRNLDDMAEELLRDLPSDGQLDARQRELVEATQDLLDFFEAKEGLRSYSRPPGVLFQQAGLEGYEGTDAGEAREWLDAKAKGLDLSTEARMARAKAMGFDTETAYYHGTNADFDAFRKDRRGVFLGTEKTAAMYSNGITLKVFVRGKIASGKDLINASKGADKWWRDFGGKQRAVAKALEAQGYAGYDLAADLGGDFVIFDPSNIRSVNAVFDPDASQSSNLLAQQGQNARGAFDPSRNEITLFEGANLSTRRQ